MQTAAVVLLLILVIGLAMLFRMKGRSEKIMVTQFLATVSVGWLMLKGYLSAKTYLFDVGLVFALLATLTTVSFIMGVRQRGGGMKTLFDIMSGGMLIFGLFFFFSGIVALWRFPDTLCRLHAITKADNLGLGLILFAVALQVGWSLILLKLIFIYILVLYGSALNGYLIAQHTHRQDQNSGAA